MSAYAPSAIKATWPHVDRAFRSVKFGGILEGSAAGNGYHHSREDLLRRGKTGAYSIQHPLDKKGNARAASAIDYVFDDVDELALVTRRLLRAAQKKDDRLFGKLREFGGTLDGDRVTAYNVTEQRFISMDDTHLWHGHLSGHRAYADDEKVWLGITEVVLGLPAGALTGPPAGGGGGTKTEWWHVDPAKVSTSLWALKDGKTENIELEPGRNVEVIDEVTDSRRTWLVTPSDNWVSKAHMKKGRYIGPKIEPRPAPKPKPKPPRYEPDQRAIYIDILHDAARRKPQNSDSVYWWQRILNAISFPGGKEIAVTGDWSAETTAETKKAQKSVRDTQDGWPGPRQIRLFANKAKSEVGSLRIYRSSKTGGLIEKT